MMHLLMKLYGYLNRIRRGKGKMIYAPHGKLFQCMVKAYFGHTDTKHTLLLGEARDTVGTLNYRNATIGTKVAFQTTRHGEIIGTVGFKGRMRKYVKIRELSTNRWWKVPYGILAPIEK